MDRYGASSRSYQHDDSDYSHRGDSSSSRRDLVPTRSSHGGRGSSSCRYDDSDSDDSVSVTYISHPRIDLGLNIPVICCCSCAGGSWRPAQVLLLPTNTGCSHTCSSCAAESMGGGRSLTSGRSRADDDELRGISSRVSALRLEGGSSSSRHSSQRDRSYTGGSSSRLTAIQESGYGDERGGSSRRSHDSRSRAAPSAPSSSSHRSGDSRITYQVEEPVGSSHRSYAGQLLLPAPSSSSRSRTSTVGRSSATQDRDDRSRHSRPSGRSGRH